MLQLSGLQHHEVLYVSWQAPLPVVYPQPPGVMADPNWYPYQQMMLYQVSPQGYVPAPVPSPAHYISGVPTGALYPYQVTPGEDTDQEVWSCQLSAMHAHRTHTHTRTHAHSYVSAFTRGNCCRCHWPACSSQPSSDYTSADSAPRPCQYSSQVACRNGPIFYP